MTTHIALVLGATGGIGGETATALEKRGWSIRALTRDPDKASKRRAGVAWDWRQGDAMNPADVIRAASGVDVIVHAVNPPEYRNWETTVIPMYESSIAAAKAADARLVTPGSFYTYAFDIPVISEDTPQTPSTRKGKIRAQAEARLQAAAKAGVRSLVVRAGDFFGPRPGGNWFSTVLVKAGKPVRSVTYPGPRGVGHSWAYLPDMAETFARLIEREQELPPFADFNFAGIWDPDGTKIPSAIARAIGNPKLPVKSFPWSLLSILGVFNVTMREVKEMQGLWTFGSRFDNKKLVDFLGEEPRTQLDDAVKETLKGLGCL